MSRCHSPPSRASLQPLRQAQPDALHVATAAMRYPVPLLEIVITVLKYLSDQDEHSIIVFSMLA